MNGTSVQRDHEVLLPDVLGPFDSAVVDEVEELANPSARLAASRAVSIPASICAETNRSSVGFWVCSSQAERRMEGDKVNGTRIAGVVLLVTGMVGRARS